MLVELGAVEQRYRAVLEVLEEGVSVTEVARRYGVVRRTVHGWLRRYAEEGLGGLADRSPRPASCPHQMSAPVEARIVAMRREHPGWDPSRIRWELERAGVVPLPGRSAVYRALVRHGLVEARKIRRVQQPDQDRFSYSPGCDRARADTPRRRAGRPPRVAPPEHRHRRGDRRVSRRGKHPATRPSRSASSADRASSATVTAAAAAS